MKKEDAKFIASLASCMEALTEFTCNLLGTVFYKDEPRMSEETLKEYKDRCYFSLSNLFKNDTEDTDKLTDALGDFIEEIFNKEALVDNKDQYFETGKDYKLKNNSFLKREQLHLAVHRLDDELIRYVEDKHLYYHKDYASFTYNYEMAASLLFQEFQFYLFNLNNANAFDMEYFERYKKVVNESHFQLHCTAELDSVSYLVKNKKGEILTLKDGEKLDLILVDSSKELEMYKKLTSKKYDGVRAIVDLDSWYRLKDEIENPKNQQANKKIETKKEVEEVKKQDAVKKETKKEPVKKAVPIKNKRKKFDFKFSFDSISLSNFLLSILPTLAMITYVIFLVTGVMDKITFSSSNFSGTLFGYEFELSGLMSNWLENTDHGFFSAITLGLIQIVLIAIGFILDLVIHLVFLILAILWFILMLIFAMCLYYVFPIAIAVLTIINFFRSDEEDKLVAGICMGVSVVCCVSYFLIGMNII